MVEVLSFGELEGIWAADMTGSGTWIMRRVCPQTQTGQVMLILPVFGLVLFSADCKLECNSSSE